MFFPAFDSSSLYWPRRQQQYCPAYSPLYRRQPRPQCSSLPLATIFVEDTGPAAEEESVLQRLLSDEYRQMHELERQLMDFVGGGRGITEGGRRNEKENNEFQFSCSVAGYMPNELNVELEGDELVISGEHRQETDSQCIHRTFSRRVRLPEGVQKDSVQCNIDQRKGRLQIRAQQALPEQPKRVQIPINFKMATEAVGQKEKMEVEQPQQQQTVQQEKEKEKEGAQQSEQLQQEEGAKGAEQQMQQ